MEDWQEYLIDLVKEMGKDRSDEMTQQLDEQSYNFLRKIANHNVNMSGEVRGVQIGGKEVRGIEAYGWGSQAKIEIDEERGTISDVAERVITEPDKIFMKFYLKSVEKQFKEMDEKERIEKFNKGEFDDEKKDDDKDKGGENPD